MSDISISYVLGDELRNIISVETISHKLLKIRKSQIREEQIPCFFFILIDLSLQAIGRNKRILITECN